MAKKAFIGFNRGLISRLAIARADLKRYAFSAETMVNWIPRVLGSMMLRPGLKYIGTAWSSTARFLRFIFSTDDTALVEITDTGVRFWVDEAVITRESVSTTITNGSFITDLSGWTDNDEAGAVSSWSAPGYMQLLGTGTNAAIRDQLVTVGLNANIEHALRIVIARGPVTLRVGSTVGGDEYVSETDLATGYHSIAFTPTGDFNIRLMSRLARIVWVDSCTKESAIPVLLPDPAITGTADRNAITYDQSGDVLFLSVPGYRQRRIERRATRSWSVVQYESLDGPFRVENTGPITITPSALTGNITLTASASLFKSTNVGSLYRLTSSGQTVTANISGANNFTNGIRVTGVGESRRFSISITGTWVATVTLQRSIGVSGNWEDVNGESWTANTAETYADELDNQIVYYRIGVKAAAFTSGTVVCTLVYTLGSITGVARVTDFTSGTSVGAEVLTDLGDTTATDVWAEGAWSDRRGWPTAVTLAEGRLCWAGKNGFWASISDAYDEFDPDFEGDAGPISRTIGSGPVDTINWLLPMQRLMLGAEGAEFSVKSTTFDEPLTPTNLSIKETSTQGSKSSQAVKVDGRGIFVQRSQVRLYELSYSVEINDYVCGDLTELVPEIGEPSIVMIAVQRQPDTRIHCVRSDGTVAILVYDSAENVKAFCEVETDGEIVDVVVLPGDVEDSVYYVVRRTINGSTVPYLEKWALESECRGGTLNKNIDSHTLYSGAATTVITGLSHLEGEEVVAWGDGVDFSPTTAGVQTTFTVASGQITLPTAVSSAIVGLPYTGSWKSTKLAHLSADGVSINERKRISRLGFILADTHSKGIYFGDELDLTKMDSLPDYEAEALVDYDTVHESYDHDLTAFPGRWGADTRLCLMALSPRPATVLAAVAEIDG